MKAFWWFRENEVAGMGRPGFNSVHFFDLNFQEATVLGWIGQHSCGAVPLQTYRDHLVHYIPRTFVFYKMSDDEGAKVVESLRPEQVILESLDQLNKRSPLFDSYEIKDDTLHFKINKNLLHKEISALQEKGIKKIVSLTERHHQRDELSEYFETHHISIEDMTAPRLEQAQQLATIIKEARNKNQPVAVHCLAGIGRTSTMIMAAHMLLGESFEDLMAEIRQKNPRYSLTTSQTDFLAKILRD